MASGVISLGKSGSIEAQILWESTVGVEENSSLIKATLQVRRVDGYTTTGTWTGYVMINGVEASFSKHMPVSSSWVSVGAPFAANKAHNADGSGTVVIGGKIQGPSGTSQAGSVCSGKETVALDTIAREATITTAPNFDDEDNPTITYSNPAGNSVTSLQACISLDEKNDNVPYRNIPKTGSSYTFNLTTAERNTLRNAIPDAKSMKVWFYVKCVIGGNTLYSKIQKTFTVVNANPTITPTIVDRNAATIALTGDNTKLIRYYSNAFVTTGAKAIKGATLESQKTTNGSNEFETATGTIEGISSGTFAFSAVDSRGNTTKLTINKELIPYVKLTCNIGSNTPTAAGDFNFTVSGNYYSGSFGAVNNTLDVYYRYKSGDTGYSGWAKMTAKISGNSYTASVAITGLDYQTNYIFQAYAADKLVNKYTNEKSIKATPIFDWGANDFNFNTNVNINGSFTVNSEWTNLTVEDGFAIYNGNVNATPRYKVCGSTVTVTGVLTPTQEFESDLSDVTIATGIPDEYTPHYAQYAICQGSGMNRWLFSVKQDGSLTMGRYGITEPTTVPVNAWLPFTLTYQY